MLFYCSLDVFAVVSLKQKLLASGVQIESDLEEFDDEVMTCVFIWIFSQKINVVKEQIQAHLNFTGGSDGPGRF